MAPRNPRRAALARIAEMKRWLAAVGRTWDQSQTTYDMTSQEVDDHWGPRTIQQAVWRPVREDEKVENDPEKWIELIDYARALGVRAQELADFAEEQHRAAQRRQGTGRPGLPGGRFL